MGAITGWIIWLLPFPIFETIHQHIFWLVGLVSLLGHNKLYELYRHVMIVNSPFWLVFSILPASWSFIPFISLMSILVLIPKKLVDGNPPEAVNRYSVNVPMNLPPKTLTKPKNQSPKRIKSHEFPWFSEFIGCVQAKSHQFPAKTHISPMEHGPFFSITRGPWGPWPRHPFGSGAGCQSWSGAGCYPLLFAGKHTKQLRKITMENYGKWWFFHILTK